MHAYFYPRPPRGGRPIAIAQAAEASVFLSTPSARRATSPSSSPMLATFQFLSTPSARRATAAATATTATSTHFYPRPPRGGRRLYHETLTPIHYISIHALREEGDRYRFHPNHLLSHFYPRPPRGGRQNPYPSKNQLEQNFYPRPPRGGRLNFQTDYDKRIEFLSTPSARRATLMSLPMERCHCYFYPRPPRGGRRVQHSFLVWHPHFYPRPPRGGRLWPIHFPTPTVFYFYPRPPRGGRRQFRNASCCSS